MGKVKFAVKEEWEDIKQAAKCSTKDLYSFDDFLIGEDGMGTVEVILIIVVLIGLVLIFKKQIRAIVETIMNKISSDSDAVMS